MENKKPNCYGCKFRGTVPGSAHSRCNLISSTVSDETKKFELEIMLATHQIQLTNGNTGEPLVSMNEMGIRGGWASWPLDFDPVWLEVCAFETPSPQK
jgi:hypothetical protein